MKIGIVADTHDGLPMVREAVGRMREAGVEAVLHCGDIVAPFTVLEMKKGGFGVWHGVLGNNDGEVLMLHRLFGELGVLAKPPYWFELGGMKVAMFHEPLPVEAMSRLPCDLVVFGHTHQAMVKEGVPLVVNPGECCGYTTGRATIAVVDTAAMRAEIVDL
ncbi:MAG: metallophosphoesterase [bacterium]